MLPPVEPLAEMSDTDLKSLRERFIAAGFGPGAYEETERIAAGQFGALRNPLVHWALARRAEPWAVLAQVFCYEGEVPQPALATALGSEIVGSLRAAGVLKAGERGMLRAAFSLIPFDEELWIMSDELGSAPEAAMGPGQTTHLLAGALPRAIRGRFLDVGCGAGSLALVAARRGARAAIGTDINPRAIAIARFNARLSGVSATFLDGDLLQPVRRERFDLVVSQPPFVAHPPGTPLAPSMHGGPRGDEVALRMIGQIPAALSRGGRAMLLMDVPSRRGEQVLPRFREALRGAGVNLLLLATPGASLDDESMAYAYLAANGVGPAYAAAAARYRGHFDDLGIASLPQTLVLMSEAADAPRASAARVPVDSLDGLCWEAIEALFASFALAALDDGALMARAVSFSSRASWVEERPRPDPESGTRIEARFPRGSLGLSRELAQASAAVIECLDAGTSVRDAIERYAELCACAPRDIEARVLEFVRGGLSSGLLEPREAGAARAPQAEPPA